MANFDGLWIARFATPAGGGAGVVALQDGRVRGGDSMMTYVGKYAVSGDMIEVQLDVQTHTPTPGMVSVFGLDQLQLSLSGKITGNSGTLSGTSPNAPGIPLSVSLERFAA